MCFSQKKTLEVQCGVHHSQKAAKCSGAQNESIGVVRLQRDGALAEMQKALCQADDEELIRLFGVVGGKTAKKLGGKNERKCNRTPAMRE